MLFVCVENECDGSFWTLFAAVRVKLVYIDNEYMYLCSHINMSKYLYIYIHVILFYKTIHLMTKSPQTVLDCLVYIPVHLR